MTGRPGGTPPRCRRHDGPVLRLTAVVPESIPALVATSLTFACGCWDRIEKSDTSAQETTFSHRCPGFTSTDRDHRDRVHLLTLVAV